jgi:hypothetical protein
MAIVGIFVSKLANYLVEKQVLFEAEQSESKMLSTINMNEIKYVLHGCSMSLLGLCVLQG